jgi:subtilisin
MATAANARSHADYIVIFKRPSENNERILTELAKMQPAKGVQTSAGTRTYSGDRGSRSRAKVFKSLACAAVSAPDEVLKQIGALKEVEAVVPNRTRSVPRPVDPLPDSGRLPWMESGPSGSRLAYLEGLRDGLDVALRMLRDGDVAAASQVLRAPGAAILDAATVSWTLEMIGIGSGYSLTGAGVTVGVLDTGIDLAHPDFQGRVTEGVNARSFINGVRSAQDGHGHGTHCAGVVAGPIHPKSGPRYGVAPGADLLIGKVLDDNGDGYDDDIIEGIQWAADNGARVVSMSLGSGREKNDAYSPLYEQIASMLYARPQGSVLLVAATGNDSARPHFTRPVGNPAACPSVLGVGAADRHSAIASFSDCKMDNIGDVDLVGPGVSVVSSWTGGGYRMDSGTSMACPHVAGVAALFLEQNQGLTAKQLLNALVQKARRLGAAEDFGSGLVQAP